MSNTKNSYIEVPTFRPTTEEFADFAGYIESIEKQFSNLALIKVIPPKGWRARKSSYDSTNFVIPHPIQQYTTGSKGAYQMVHIEKKSMNVRDFEAYSEEENVKVEKDDFNTLERKFWKSLTFNPPLYGADFLGSLFDDDVDIWNLTKLDTLLKSLKVNIPGINQPYLYVGMFKSAFCWHVEDKNLYSINYLHFGKPKTWYGIPPSQAPRFEQMAQGYFHDEYRECNQFLRHKTTLLSPHLIKQYNIPLVKAVQEEGEFMITFPSAFHAGFNHGFNCAEAVNFASERWIEYGKLAKTCTCRKDTVRFDVIFEQKIDVNGVRRMELTLKVPEILVPVHNVEPEDPNLYCICRKKAYGFMVACDSCNDWFHEKCVNLDRRFKADQEKSVEYVCPGCESKKLELGQDTTEKNKNDQQHLSSKPPKIKLKMSVLEQLQAEENERAKEKENEAKEESIEEIEEDIEGLREFNEFEEADDDEYQSGDQEEMEDDEDDGDEEFENKRQVAKRQKPQQQKSPRKPKKKLKIKIKNPKGSKKSPSPKKSPARSLTVKSPQTTKTRTKYPVENPKDLILEGKRVRNVAKYDKEEPLDAPKKEDEDYQDFEEPENDDQEYNEGEEKGKKRRFPSQNSQNKSLRSSVETLEKETQGDDPQSAQKKGQSLSRHPLFRQRHAKKEAKRQTVNRPPPVPSLRPKTL